MGLSWLLVFGVLVFGVLVWMAEKRVKSKKAAGSEPGGLGEVIST